MKISIPEPCSEDWSKMTPTEKGAFCQKCALEVTDFTNKTSLEIKEILSEKIETKQRVCGHIENRQLIEFNDGFIPWKSDQESFRAVWMFSLIAVFGMTLFSCQSTFSKEVVEKMRTNSELLMEEDNDTLDVALLIDTLKQSTPEDSLPTWLNPWENPYQISGGAIVDLHEVDWEVNICTTWTGSLVTAGFILYEPYVEDERTEKEKTLNGIDEAYSLVNNIVPLPPKSSPNNSLPNAHNQNQQNAQRIDAKHESGKPDFKAYISPTPVDETSKMYLTIPEEGALKISIWELNTMTKLYAETLNLVFGNHTVDINFKDFPEGKYAAQLIWEEEKVVLPFEVVEKTRS